MSASSSTLCIVAGQGFTLLYVTFINGGERVERFPVVGWDVHFDDSDDLVILPLSSDNAVNARWRRDRTDYSVARLNPDGSVEGTDDTYADEAEWLAACAFAEWFVSEDKRAAEGAS